MKSLIIPLLVLVASQACGQSNRPRTSQPNIVLIMADDLGWADVAFHGGNAPTPQLDQLARDGLELAAHYVAPVCSPTRAGLLTGRYWSRFGVVNPQNNRALPWDTITLARALNSVGYDTCLSGKWHLGSLPEEGPNHFGFDYSYGSLAGGVTPWEHRYKTGPYSETWHRNERLIDEEGHVTDLITEAALQWLQARDDSPFFLYVPFTAVHLPVDEPEAWLARVPQAIQGDVARHYAASIMHLDDSVGRILRSLEEEGHRDNTLVIFTSDNGGSTAENRDTKYPNNDAPQGRLPGNNHPLRGEKGSVYEGGTRVPTVVSWPGVIRPGSADSPVHIVDWMPTLCALAGYQATPELKWDGSDLSDLLIKHQPLAPRSLYCVGPGGRARAVRYGDWKLVVQERGDKTQLELFEIAKDPNEEQNLADELPERVRELRERLSQVSQADNDAQVKAN